MARAAELCSPPLARELRTTQPAQSLGGTGEQSRQSAPQLTTLRVSAVTFVNRVALSDVRRRPCVSRNLSTNSALHFKRTGVLDFHRSLSYAEG